MNTNSYRSMTHIALKKRKITKKGKEKEKDMGMFCVGLCLFFLFVGSRDGGIDYGCRYMRARFPYPPSNRCWK